MSMGIIADNNGYLVYSGNEINPKFARELGKPGHKRIDVSYLGGLKKPMWDGSAWVEGETDLEAWQKKMVESDGPLPRWAEDLVDGAISSQTQKLADDKKALRSEKP